MLAPMSNERRLGPLKISAIALSPLLVLALFHGVPSMNGFGPAAVAAANACPLATEALGGEIRHAWFGLSWGSTSKKGGTNWTYPVQGPRGAASMKIVERTGQRDFLQYAVIDTASGPIEVVSCTRNAGQPPIVATRFKGRIIDASGSAPAASGAACDVSIGPGEPGKYPCRLTVQCGGKTIYGEKPTGGYLSCRVEQAGLLAQDRETSDDGTDPAVSLDPVKKQLTVWESGATTWKVTVALTAE